MRLVFYVFHPPFGHPKGDITGGTLLIFFWIPAPRFRAGRPSPVWRYCPPLAGVARRAGGGLVVFCFASSPCAPPKGDITGGTLLIIFWIPAFAGMTILSTAGGGGPPRGPGVDFVVLAFRPPPAPPPKGDICGVFLVYWFKLPCPSRCIGGDRARLERD